MTLNTLISNSVTEAVNSLYQSTITESQVQLQKTRKDFDGDITLIVFPFLKISKKPPEATAEEIGNFLVKQVDIVSGFNVVKGFLNLVIDSLYYHQFLSNIKEVDKFGLEEAVEGSETIMIEYSSPNTNKPLHLGHVRNNLLGYSVAEIVKASGRYVVKTNIVNDRGIHICKSMLAWQKWGDNQEPGPALKGDKLVGDYYVRFDVAYKEEIKDLIAQGKTEEEAKKEAPILKEAQDMLRKWEQNDPEVHALWKKMNQWVYDGFDVTYKRLGVNFDKIYYESDTYVIGRDTVLEGLKKEVFEQREDSSVWADLTPDGLDQKILLRSDGTSVYMTQDIGTAQVRQQDYQPDKMVYVVGNEQIYHFKVLALILDKLGYKWAKGLYHMAYGMVELPEGKMKSREGTVVDADDLMDEMIETAKSMSNELGKLEGLSEEEKEEIYRVIGLGALKYFILKVDPNKNMTFDPKESIDFNGNTGPFIQYTYARIRSLFRKAEERKMAYKTTFVEAVNMSAKEKSLVKLIHDFPGIVNDAAANYSPAFIANYVYELVKEYNQFYHDHAVLNEENESIRNFRLALSNLISSVIKTGMGLLGIEMPERM